MKTQMKTLLTLLVAALLFTSQAPAAILAGPITNPANAHIYYLLTSNTWTGAEAEAVTLGGHLVTLNDRAENDWICTTFITNGGIQRSLWIGLYQPNGSPEPDGGWTWVSGDTSDFRWWMTNTSGGHEPNNNTAFGPQNWAHIWPPSVEPVIPNSYRTNSWNDYWNVGMVLDPPLTNQMIGLYGVVEVGPPLPVPTLSEWALIILGGLMLGVGILFLRRRQGASAGAT
jgi:hypothetical protein